MSDLTPALCVISCLAALAIAPVGAHAASPGAVKVAIVSDDDGKEAVELSFDRSMLGTAEGRVAVHQAIGRAARHVCAAYLGDDESPDRAACRDQAIAESERPFGGRIEIAPATEILASAR